MIESLKLETGCIFSPQLAAMSKMNSVDPSRANMAAKQSTQTMVDKNCSIPYILSKESAYMSQCSDIFKLFAKDDGFVLFKHDDMIIFYYTTLKKMELYKLDKYISMIYHCVPLSYVINKSTFKKGDLLYSYESITQDKIMRIGHRMRVAYTAMLGFNVEDAMVMSQSTANRCTYSKSTKILIPILKHFKYSSDDKIWTLPKIGDTFTDGLLCFMNPINHSVLGEMEHINEPISTFFSQEIAIDENSKVYSVKVHKFTKDDYDIIKKRYILQEPLIDSIKNEITNQRKNYELIYKKLLTIYKNEKQSSEFANLLYRRYYESEKFHSKQLDGILEDYKLNNHEDIDFVIELDFEKTSITKPADKFTNMFAGKGVVGLIFPKDIVIKDEQGNPIDLFFNFIGIPSRNNWATIFEATIGKIFEFMKQNLNNKSLIIELLKEFAKFCKIFDEPYSHSITDLIKLIQIDENIWTKFKDDIIEKGFYLYIDSFAKCTFTQFVEFAEACENISGINFTKKEKIHIPKEYIDWMSTQKNYQFEFKYDENGVYVEAYVGCNTLLKLHHTDDSKYNSCDIATNFRAMTGQPLKGRKNKGGTHFGWQSLACLLSHDVPDILKEMFTIKSDSVSDSIDFIRKILGTGEYILKDKYNSQTFNSLSSIVKFFAIDISTDNL